MKRLAVLLVLVGVVVLPIVSGFGQIIYGDPPILSGRVIYQKWNLSTTGGKDTSLTQIDLPISAMIPLAPHWEVHINGALSHSKLEYGSNSASLSSLAPSAVKIYRSFAADRLFVAGGIVIPTGKTGYDSLEVGISELISDDYLNLPVKQIASGPGFQLQFGGASKYEWLLYGGSIGYNYAGSYKYFEVGDKYDPGDDVTLQASGSAVAGSGALDLDLAYKIFGADKQASNQVFKNGGIFSTNLTGRYNVGATSLSLMIAEIVRSKNSLQFGSSLRAEDNNSNHNKTIVRGTVGYQFSPQNSIVVLAEYRALSANGYESTSQQYFGRSDLFSFGGSFTYAAPDNRYELFGKLVFSTGEANKGAEKMSSVSISGTELSVGGRIRL